MRLPSYALKLTETKSFKKKNLRVGKWKFKGHFRPIFKGYGYVSFRESILDVAVEVKQWPDLQMLTSIAGNPRYQWASEKNPDWSGVWPDIRAVKHWAMSMITVVWHVWPFRCETSGLYLDATLFGKSILPIYVPTYLSVCRSVYPSLHPSLIYTTHTKMNTNPSERLQVQMQTRIPYAYTNTYT